MRKGILLQFRMLAELGLIDQLTVHELVLFDGHQFFLPAPLLIHDAAGAVVIEDYQFLIGIHECRDCFVAASRLACIVRFHHPLVNHDGTNV